MKRCAILSMDSLEDFEAYDHLVEPFLHQLGWKTDTISWRQSDVNWSNFDLVVIRTPWDYQDEPERFMAVLEQIEASPAVLENSIDIVRWNIDKIYLKELEQKGVLLVPTIWHERLGEEALSEAQLNAMFAQVDSEQIVLKPRISANADNTFWLKQDSAGAELAQLNTAFSSRDFMAQPFMPAIIEEGEYSLFYFNGGYSHAILKTPKNQDFRVQEEHGGRLKTIEPEQELVRCAKVCIEAIDQVHETPLYARLDFVRHGDTFALMEAELIEPSLYFNMDDSSPERFANAIEARYTSY